MSTKEKAIENAQYLINRTRKPMFIYKMGNGWHWTENSLKEAQSTYEFKILEYQEVKCLEGYQGMMKY